MLVTRSCAGRCCLLSKWAVSTHCLTNDQPPPPQKHIDDYPELKAEKMAMNRRTLKAMQQALNQGGKLLWIAPSGGRDRSKDPANGKGGEGSLLFVSSCSLRRHGNCCGSCSSVAGTALKTQPTVRGIWFYFFLFSS